MTRRAVRLLVVAAALCFMSGRQGEHQAGAGAPARQGAEPRLLTDFDLKIRLKEKAYSLVFIYRGKQELLSPNMTITLMNSNSRTTTRRGWARWQPGQEVAIEAPRDEGAWIREVHLQGGAFLRLPGEENRDRLEVVRCACRWSGEKR